MLKHNLRAQGTLLSYYRLRARVHSLTLSLPHNMNIFHLHNSMFCMLGSFVRCTFSTITPSFPSPDGRSRVDWCPLPNNHPSTAKSDGSDFLPTSAEATSRSFMHHSCMQNGKMGMTSWERVRSIRVSERGKNVCSPRFLLKPMVESHWQNASLHLIRSF